MQVCKTKKLLTSDVSLGSIIHYNPFNGPCDPQTVFVVLARTDDGLLVHKPWQFDAYQMIYGDEEDYLEDYEEDAAMLIRSDNFPHWHVAPRASHASFLKDVERTRKRYGPA